MQHMCQYGNCQETDTPILLSINNTDPQGRIRFCSLIHAALWAKKQLQRGPYATYGTPYTAEEARELGISHPLL